MKRNWRSCLLGLSYLVSSLGGLRLTWCLSGVGVQRSGALLSPGRNFENVCPENRRQIVVVVGVVAVVVRVDVANGCNCIGLFSEIDTGTGEWLGCWAAEGEAGRRRRLQLKRQHLPHLQSRS